MARKDATLRTNVWKKRAGWLAGGAAVVTICLAARHQFGPDEAVAQAPRQQPSRSTTPARQPAPQAAEASQPQVMANVNGVEIGRQQLANACIARFGEDVLESVVNKHLIAIHCKDRGITITRAEIDEEIKSIAGKFQLAPDLWLQMLQQERGVSPEEYARDIIWPTLALRKLAGDRVSVTSDELKKEHDREFGPAVQARMIAVSDVNSARKLHAQLQAQPDEFAAVARQHSEDAPERSAGGLLHPIRRHMGDPNIERTVFQLRPGEVSPIVRVGEQYTIFKCEKHLPARDVPIKAVQSRLHDKVRERKLREIAGDLFKDLQESSQVVNVYNDPELSRKMPGVAATINGHPLHMRDLAEECVARHGEMVLEGEINKLLLEQALKQRRLTVTQADVDAEIAHAAVLAGVITPDGKADLKKWFEMVTREQEISRDLYVRDVVWPSAALKKLVEKGVKVEEADLTKGYQANYGPRVRCRAIVMSNLRRAQDVWSKARQNPTVEFFGKLAQEYSIEPTAKSLHGEVPPIRRHSGNPLLEKAAFALSPGDISEIVQVGDKFVFLFCEGHTKPIQVSEAEVRELIHSDVYEKKLRVAMGQQFEKVREGAQIDNFLAGTSQSPKKANIAAGTRTGVRR